MRSWLPYSCLSGAMAHEIVVFMVRQTPHHPPVLKAKEFFYSKLPVRSCKGASLCLVLAVQESVLQHFIIARLKKKKPAIEIEPVSF